jgi:hypothetical protein
MLHVDHEHGSSPPRIRGLLCPQCNYDLEAFTRKCVIYHPGGHGASLPRKDPRFVKYLREREGQAHKAAGWTAKKGEGRRPSETFDRYWIYAERKDPASYPGDSDRSGKWLVFVKKAEVDQWWAKIKEATENGRLGGVAKVATMKENPNATSADMKVICVYIYGVDDEEDCNRIRQALRELGVTWKIPYKADADTLAGRYSRKGGAGRISKRYE